MVTNPEAYASFKRYSRSDRAPDLDASYRILESLYQEARRLGSLTDRDLLLGLDTDVRLAAALNANVSAAPR